MRDNSLINRIHISVFSVTVRSLAARKKCALQVWVRMPAYILKRLSFKAYSWFKTQCECTYQYNIVPWLYQTFWNLFYFSKSGNNHFKIPVTLPGFPWPYETPEILNSALLQMPPPTCCPPDRSPGRSFTCFSACLRRRRKRSSSWTQAGSSRRPCCRAFSSCSFSSRSTRSSCASRDCRVRDTCRSISRSMDVRSRPSRPLSCRGGWRRGRGDSFKKGPQTQTESTDVHYLNVWQIGYISTQFRNKLLYFTPTDSIRVGTLHIF